MEEKASNKGDLCMDLQGVSIEFYVYFLVIMYMVYVVCLYMSYVMFVVVLVGESSKGKAKEQGGSK